MREPNWPVLDSTVRSHVPGIKEELILVEPEAAMDDVTSCDVDDPLACTTVDEGTQTGECELMKYLPTRDRNECSKNCPNPVFLHYYFIISHW